MKARQVVRVAAAVFLLMEATLAWADSFTNSPAWWSSFPYPRDVDMNFNVDPAGPPSGSGIPGATYAGTGDPTLMLSDSITLSGATQWIPPWTAFTCGALGVVNPGSGVLTGAAAANLGNATCGRPLHLWVEMICFSGIGTSVDLDVAASGGRYSVATLGAIMGGDLYPEGCWEGFMPVNGASFQRFNCEYEITPNPGNEQVVVSFSAAHGAFCDAACVLELHVATEAATPPPSPRLAAPAWLANGGGLRLTVVGEVGANYEIQASETATNWHTLGVISTPQGTNSFTDTGAGTNRLRFYRARCAP